MHLTIPYKPRPEQRPFHSSRAKVRFLRGGVGAGKTIAGAAESVRLSIVNSGTDGMIVAPTWPLLQRVTLREFERLLPKELIRVQRKKERHFELINGSRVYYGSSDKPDTLEGSNLSWMWGDEVRYWKPEAWNVALARVRTDSPQLSIILTSTPSMGWLYQEFGESERHDVGQWVVPTHTNPYLAPGFLDGLKRRYSARLYEQYCEGKWVLLEGGVFESFDKNLHVQQLEPIPDLPVDVAVDFGYHRPAALFVQKIQYCHHHGVPNCVHVVDEIVEDGFFTQRLAIRIAEKYGETGWQRGECVCDPAGNARSTAVGYSDIDILERPGEHGLDVPPLICRYTYEPECRYIPNGIAAIDAKLMNTAGQASLFFDERMTGEDHDRGILKAMQMSAYPTDKEGKVTSDEPIKDKHIEDARDALRYYIVNHFPPISGRITLH